jgi:hypothetical protein
VEIYSVFVMVVMSRDVWEVDDEATILKWNSNPSVFHSDDDVVIDDFLLGTYSSPELAETDLAKFLSEYKVDDAETSDKFNGWNQPIRGITLWKTELDVGQAKGEFVKWMRGNSESPLEYPYE